MLKLENLKKSFGGVHAGAALEHAGIQFTGGNRPLNPCRCPGNLRAVGLEQGARIGAVVEVGEAVLVQRDVERAGRTRRDGAREVVYGMPYADWQALHQSEATPDQKAAFDKAIKAHG